MGKMTLEELLNKLIEKGWKPFGRDTQDIDEIQIERLDRMGCYQDMDYISFLSWDYEREELFVKYGCSIRDLVSKSSGLWQFVCENGMTKKHTDIRVRCNEKTSKTYQDSDVNQDYEYRLIESSLKDESELEEFLLDNINIDG